MADTDNPIPDDVWETIVANVLLVSVDLAIEHDGGVLTFACLSRRTVSLPTLLGSQPDRFVQLVLVLCRRSNQRIARNTSAVSR
jgi:hypothetical protein